MLSDTFSLGVFFFCLFYFRRITGGWMGHIRRKIGEGMYQILVVTVGMKRRGKLGYLVGKNARRKGIKIMATEKMSAALTMFLLENLLIQEVPYHLIGSLK